MQIQVDVDDHIDSSEELIIRVEGVVEGSLDRFQDRITRVEVQLSRLNRHPPGGHDLCCHMEAHAGGKPIAVSHEAMTLTEAIHAASAKLGRAIHTAFSQLKSKDAEAAAAKDDEGPTPEGLGHFGSS
jgi:ribosome-associated translation inhibitor RaiA